MNCIPRLTDGKFFSRCFLITSFTDLFYPFKALFQTKNSRSIEQTAMLQGLNSEPVSFHAALITVSRRYTETQLQHTGCLCVTFAFYHGKIYAFYHKAVVSAPRLISTIWNRFILCWQNMCFLTGYVNSSTLGNLVVTVVIPKLIFTKTH